MATLTITSPGVQINEVDLSQIVGATGPTTIFVTGFAAQGPTNEIINVSSISDFKSIFGEPSNPAERYLYNTASQILNQSPSNLLVTRMAYGSGAGAGYSNQYSALVYPLSSNAPKYADSTDFRVLAPKSILLTDEQYTDLIQNAVAWGDGYVDSNILSFNDLSKKGGLVVLDSAKTSIDELYQGYYVGVVDNTNYNPATDFVSITGIKAANAIVNGNYQTFVTVPTARLDFTLSQAFSAGGTSISQLVEQFPSFNFGTNYYNDSLTVVVFKVRTSIYAQNTVMLDYVVSEGYTGSLNGARTQNNVNGGAPVSFFLDNIANKSSSSVKIITNPNIANTGTWTDANGIPSKKVRVSNEAKNLFSEGVYIPQNDKLGTDIGNVPAKLQKVLQRIDDLDVSLDLVAEAGLGTIWAGSVARRADVNYGNNTGPYYFDDTYTPDISVLKTQTNDPVGGIVNDYLAVASQFVTFAETTRKDHLFIADPLRYIMVQGENAKITKETDFVFSRDVYWPLNNQFGSLVSSYATTYGNWLKVNDITSNKQVWVPASGWAAAIMASASRTGYPWSAPAGFNRALLSNVVDIAINPTQKQRDLLYNININPITFFPGDGFVLFGQKTLYTIPSAFDRINVRRLFLTLEKATKAALKYFVFEPNSYITRTRLVNTISPIFEKAKNSEGLYAYQIVCDTRNNPPSVIDNNQLNVSIYIQPVRTAEFILADFIATQTGVSFNELIANNQF